jgi:tetratricopeptide (TPR) repeat protein
VLIRHYLRVIASGLTLSLLAAMLCPVSRADDKDKKEKPPKEEKQEPWVEIRTANFVVASDGGEKAARRIAEQFEQVRRVFEATMPNARFSAGIPIQIMAARSAQSFARLFREFPANKNREQPNGVFVQGPEKIYIGLRTNVSGRAPYAEIIQDYARVVLKLSYRSLPPWLEEGYSNVYGSVEFTDKGPRLERTDPDDLSVLFESPLLPLDLIFRADRSSPYYSGGGKNTVFYAESRALTHFLLSDPQISSAKSMERYVSQVEHGTDSLKAARDAFGDLGQLQAKLEAYVKAVNSPPVDIAVAGGGDSGGAPRTWSAPEAEAHLAELMAVRGHREDAQDKLEEALKSEPTLAVAEQTLGFLTLRMNDLDAADQHFAHAAQLDPNDSLTYYGQGMAAMTRGGFVGVPVVAVAAFEKCVALNPNFALAWYNLATIYAERPETMQKALTDARRAAELAPGDSGYQLQLATILDRAGRTDEARKTASEVQSSTSDRKAADKAGDLLARMSPPPASSAKSPPPNSPPSPGTAPSASPAASPATTAPANSPAKSAAAGTLRIERKTEPEDKPSATISNAPRSEPDPATSSPSSSSSPRVYSMVGTITETACANAPQIQITLKSQTIVMKLHADNFSQVAVKSAGSNAIQKNTVCAALRGHSARVSYFLAEGKPWDGEIQTVEFRSQ